MNPADPLVALKPLREPDAISWWPLAPGWWMLLALIMVLLIAGAVWLWRRHRANAYRRGALSALAHIEQQWQQDRNDADALAQINALLKATALRVDKAGDCAGLFGQAWLAHLEKALPGSQVPEALGNQAYRRTRKVDVHQLTQYAQRWIQKHRVPHA